MLSKKDSNVICPFCCHKFHANMADFRLQTGEVLLDEKLYNYNIDILQLEKEEATKSATTYRAIIFEEQKDNITHNAEDIEKFGFVQEIALKDTVAKTDQRLCPNCHNNLPIGYGLRDTVLISVLGDARSGKSVFLTMLIHELENNTDFVSKLTFIGDKKVRDIFHEMYQKPLLKEFTLVSSTKRRRMPPYAFNFWYQYKNTAGVVEENTIDVIFYDIAGEDLRDDFSIRKHGFNIKDSSGLIFLVDPVSFNRLKDLFLFSDTALMDAIPEENSTQAIFDNLYNFFVGMDIEKSKIPLALTLSKADLFRHVDFDFFKNKPENRIQHVLKDEINKGAVNIPSIKGINEEVRELLAYLGEESILNNAIGCFKSVNCFAVSSLGKKPVVEQISDPTTNETIEKGFVDKPLAPFRVKDPFYWILMRNKLMLGYENNHYNTYEKEPEKKQDKTSGEENTDFWLKIKVFFAKLLQRK